MVSNMPSYSLSEPLLSNLSNSQPDDHNRRFDTLLHDMDPYSLLFVPLRIDHILVYVQRCGRVNREIFFYGNYFYFRPCCIMCS